MLFCWFSFDFEMIPEIPSQSCAQDFQIFVFAFSDFLCLADSKRPF